MNRSTNIIAENNRLLKRMWQTCIAFILYNEIQSIWTFMRILEFSLVFCILQFEKTNSFVPNFLLFKIQIKKIRKNHTEMCFAYFVSNNCDRNQWMIFNEWPNVALAWRCYCATSDMCTNLLLQFLTLEPPLLRTNLYSIFHRYSFILC